MKKTLATLALATLALTGCTAGNNTDDANKPSPTATSASASPTTEAKEYKGYHADVYEDGSITWTGPEGNKVDSVPEEIEMNYPFTEEQLESINYGREMRAKEQAEKAQPQPPVGQEIGYKGHIAHVDEDGDVTWTDLNGNPIPSVDWDVALNYPYTPEEQARIQKGLEELEQEIEAETDALVETEFGQASPDAAFDPSDTAIPGDTMTEEQMRSYCENLDPTTASSGESQMCWTKFGL